MKIPDVDKAFGIYPTSVDAGRQGDDGCTRLVFDRPDEFSQNNLRLFIQLKFNDTPSIIDLGLSDEFTLTQLQTNSQSFTLQVAFMTNNEIICRSNKVTFYLTSSLEKDAKDPDDYLQELLQTALTSVQITDQNYSESYSAKVSSIQFKNYSGLMKGSVNLPPVDQLLNQLILLNGIPNQIGRWMAFDQSDSTYMDLELITDLTISKAELVDAKSGNVISTMDDTSIQDLKFTLPASTIKNLNSQAIYVRFYDENNQIYDSASILPGLATNVTGCLISLNSNQSLFRNRLVYSGIITTDGSGIYLPNLK